MAENQIFKTQLIERVQEGMVVVDFEDNRLGKVDYMKMGDPEAVTTQGNDPSFETGVIPLTDDDDEPEVPEPLRSDLLRNGFIKIDDGSLFDTDRYVRADEIAEVVGDTVRLKSGTRTVAEGEDKDIVTKQRSTSRKDTVIVPPAAAGLGLPSLGNR